MPASALRSLRPVVAVGVAILALSTSALAQSPGAASPVPSGAALPLRVEGAWARTSPMMELAGAAFMVLINDGPTDDALVTVGSPRATTVEIHQTTTDANGVMAMAPVASVPVPAGGRTELAPGGYHVMLIGLLEPLLEGDVVPLTLTFQSGTVIEVQATVSAVAPGSSAVPMGSVVPGGSPTPSGSPGM
ncbi:MAG: copper chaperone PCu(A)C [Chloroflexota bacterium]